MEKSLINATYHSQSLLETQKERILVGMRHWEDHTCLRFKQRTVERDYIEFYNGSW